MLPAASPPTAERIQACGSLPRQRWSQRPPIHEQRVEPQPRVGGGSAPEVYEALFREINERVRKLEASFDVVDPVPTSDWFCECANERCFDRITMPQSEYDVIREEGARFLMAPSDDHVWSDVEDIVQRHDQHWIVEKIPG